MTDITTEIETLRDYVEDTSDYSRIWMQHLPSKYTPGELSIRYSGDTSDSETAVSYRYDREYQFVYFGESEVECIRNSSAIQRKFNSEDAIQIKDSKRYLRIGSFSMSQPFKTESGAVFAVIGVLQAAVREMRQIEETEKIAEIETDISY